MSGKPPCTQLNGSWMYPSDVATHASMLADALDALSFVIDIANEKVPGRDLAHLARCVAFFAHDLERRLPAEPAAAAQPAAGG